MLSIFYRLNGKNIDRHNIIWVEILIWTRGVLYAIEKA